ncbi:MAG TPA: VOC family protein [Gaiellales bacterium]|nr:VOC family protein [Gaiellales bacterium]
MSTPFAKVHHICVAVRDIEAAIAYYESVGIGPWHDYPPLEEFTTLEVPDPDGFRRLDYRYAWIGDFQLQLVQPGPEPTPQRRFLDEHGEGVFHVGFEVPDADAADAQAAGLGVAPLMRGRRDNGSGFTYYDTADRAGVVLEIRQSPPA